MTKHKPSPLRDTARRAIVEALEKSAFVRHNFAADFDDLKERGALVAVSFLPNKSYFFKLLKGPNYPTEPRFTTMECPGRDLGEAFRSERQDFAECLAALEGWTKRIVEDYRHGSPLFDEVQAFKEAMEAELAAHIKNPQPHSSGAVAPDLQARLDAIGHRIEDLERQCAGAVRKLEQFEVRLTEMGERANGATHASWFKPTGVKIVE
ncbi:MAG: hypothetical protein ACLQVX_25545 [Limisphaerales bacterium]